VTTSTVGCISQQTRRALWTGECSGSSCLETHSHTVGGCALGTCLQGTVTMDGTRGARSTSRSCLRWHSMQRWVRGFVPALNSTCFVAC
jgi:hypothetical protein